MYQLKYERLPAALGCIVLKYGSIFRLATCFDHVGLSSSHHYEPINVRKLRTKINSKVSCPLDTKLLHLSL
jgi:hypothetical protein